MANFVKVFSINKNMNERFRDLARFVADESRAGDSGCRISRETTAAYQEMLQIYDGIMDDEFANDPNFERRMASVRGFIGDIPRTVLMIRAMARATRAHGENCDPIHVVEAGCGSGLLCGVAVVLDEKVRAIGIDAVGLKVEATRALLKRLDVEEGRWQVRDANILREPNEGRVDVLVAEHISRGLQTESATAIPRAFDVDPNFVVPYAVTPVVMWGGRTTHVPNDGHKIVFPSGQMGVFGKEIVLADRTDSNMFFVEGSAVLRLGRTPILVASDIRWASPLFEGKPLYQSSREDASFEIDGVTHNHLMGAALLRAGFCMDAERIKRNSYGEKMEYWGIDNPTSRNQVTRFGVSYPIGFDGYQHNKGWVGAWVSNSNLRLVARFASEFQEE